METIFIENNKMNETNKLVLNMSYKLDLKSSNRHVAFSKLINYTWKNIRKQYENNKLKIIGPVWNDEFELPDGSYSVSDIKDHVEYIIKKNEI